jgi:DNA-directed RNA polymerase specialized sigma24 family protein
MTGRSKNTIDAHLSAAEAPWEALYDAHANDLARYLRRLVGDPDTAADLMQETFARAARQAQAGRRRDAAMALPDRVEFGD